MIRNFKVMRSVTICIIIFILSLITNPCFITDALVAITQRDEDDQSSESTTNLRSWRGQTNLHHQHHLITAANGSLSMFGWGTLIPIGAIIARYLRKFPMHWNEWFSFHVTCQTGGYILGTIGWLIALFTSDSSHTLPHEDHHKSHRILGIIIFTFTTLQMLAIIWHPKEEDDYSYCCMKRWQIYHQLLGYALIGIIIAYIFQGINYQSQATMWRWTYIGILVVLSLTCISLETFKRVRSKLLKETVELNSNMYTSS